MAAYVKFSRGLISAYNNLSVKDQNTLYLVYESENSPTGSLYLGNKLISSVSGSEITPSLSELSDVSIGTLQDGMILQYNASTGGGVWQAIPISDVIIPSENGNRISIEDSLENIENPREKDIAVIENTAYIYNNNKWVRLTDSLLEDRIETLENNVGHAADISESIPATGLYAELEELKNSLDNVYTKSEIAEQIAQAQHLRYEIVDNLEDIDFEKDNTIYLVPRDNSEENNIYDEYFIINQELEKIGTWSIDLSNYIQNNDDRLLTQEQKQKIDAITLDENNSLVITSSQVSDLNTLLENQQLIKSVQVGVFNITPEKELQLVGVPANLLNNYVTIPVFNAAVGDLSLLLDRVSENSSLVEEINSIKDNLNWKIISAE